jgi:hypothetical protein
MAEGQEAPATQKVSIIELPQDYQKQGYGDSEEIDVTNADIATVEDILGLSENLPRDWVYLPALKRRVEVEAITDEERQLVNKRARKVFNKSNKRMEPDPDSVLHHLILLKVVSPKIPSVNIVAKMAAGDLARIVRSINRLSGMTSMDMDDALE